MPKFEQPPYKKEPGKKLTPASELKIGSEVIISDGVGEVKTKITRILKEMTGGTRFMLENGKFLLVENEDETVETPEDTPEDTRAKN